MAWSPAPGEPTYEQVVQRARDMVPKLRERSREVERLRRLHPDTLGELRESGLMRVLQPRAFGGWEMDFSILVDVAYELGRGCASTSWVFENNSMHSLIAAYFPLEAQEELWEEGHRDRTVSTGWKSKYAEARPVEGGFRLSGHWEFSSGCHNCEAALVLAPVVQDPPSPVPDMRLFLLFHFADEYEIHDVWDTVALRGTGSDELSARDLFVPEHRSMKLADANRLEPGAVQGAGVHRSTWYRTRLWDWFPYTVAPTLVGTAQGALEHTLERLKTRRDLFGTLLGETQAVQLRIAEASAKIHAARLMLAHAIRRMGELADRGEVPSPEERGAWRRDSAYTAVLASEVVSSLFYRGGAHGLFQDDSLQRAWRDVCAGATHVGTDWDVAGSICGRTLQGLDVANPNF